MTPRNGDNDSDPGTRRGDFRQEVGSAEPSPVTDAMITPRTTPGKRDGVATGEGKVCRVCDELNLGDASYCLACGVRLTDPPTAEPLDWIDDEPPPGFDPGAGLMDLGEMAEVTSLQERRKTSDEAEDQPQPPDDPPDRKRTIKMAFGWIVGLIVLFLLFTTFRGSGEEAAPTTTTIAVDQTELDAYGAEISTIGARVIDLNASGIAINGAWDDETEEFGATLAAMRLLESQAAALPDLLNSLTAPQIIGPAAHQRLVDSASTLAAAAGEMVEGLKSSDTGEARRGALAKFQAAAVEFTTLARGVSQAVSSSADGPTE